MYNFFRVVVSILATLILVGGPALLAPAIGPVLLVLSLATGFLCGTLLYYLWEDVL